MMDLLKGYYQIPLTPSEKGRKKVVVAALFSIFLLTATYVLCFFAAFCSRPKVTFC